MTNIVSQANSLVDDMTPEELNDHVDYIRAVFKAKREMAAAKNRSSLKVGTKVRLTGNYKPKYLNGLTGVIDSFNQTRVWVKLDCGPVGKFRNGKVLTGAAGLKVLED